MIPVVRLHYLLRLSHDFTAMRVLKRSNEFDAFQGVRSTCRFFCSRSSTCGRRECGYALLDAYRVTTWRAAVGCSVAWCCAREMEKEKRLDGGPLGRLAMVPRLVPAVSSAAPSSRAKSRSTLPNGRAFTQRTRRRLSNFAGAILTTTATLTQRTPRQSPYILFATQEPPQDLNREDVGRRGRSRGAPGLPSPAQGRHLRDWQRQAVQQVELRGRRD